MALDREKRVTVIYAGIDDVTGTSHTYMVRARIEMFDGQGVADEEATAIRKKIYKTWADLPTPAKQFLQDRIN